MTLTYLLIGLMVVALAIWGFHQGAVLVGGTVAGLALGGVLGWGLAAALPQPSSRIPLALIFGLLFGGALALAGERLAARAVRGRNRVPTADALAGSVLLAVAGLLAVWLISPLTAMLVPPPHPTTSVTITGPAADVPEGPDSIATDEDVLAARGSTARIVSEGCGAHGGASGWIAPNGSIVTAAHVVAGSTSVRVQRGGTGEFAPAIVIAINPAQDIALLDAPSLRRTRGLELADAARIGEPAAITGYPNNGPYEVERGRVGSTGEAWIVDGFGREGDREITAIRGAVRVGTSGGPALNSDGEVLMTLFATDDDRPDEVGYGIPNVAVNAILAGADVDLRPDTGPCPR